jgi:hypothetical protein
VYTQLVGIIYDSFCRMDATAALQKIGDSFSYNGSESVTMKTGLFSTIVEKMVRKDANTLLEQEASIHRRLPFPNPFCAVFVPAVLPP